jgi:hypothetical protein
MLSSSISDFIDKAISPFTVSSSYQVRIFLFTSINDPKAIAFLKRGPVIYSLTTALHPYSIVLVSSLYFSL